VVLQHAHAISILRCVVVVGEGLFRLNILSNCPPLSLFDMLLMIGGGSGIGCSPCGSSS
jgi:hypothetical protein